MNSLTSNSWSNDEQSTFQSTINMRRLPKRIFRQTMTPQERFVLAGEMYGKHGDLNCGNWLYILSPRYLSLTNIHSFTPYYYINEQCESYIQDNDFLPLPALLNTEFHKSHEICLVSPLGIALLYEDWALVHYLLLQGAHPLIKFQNVFSVENNLITPINYMLNLFKDKTTIADSNAFLVQTFIQKNWPTELANCMGKVAIDGEQKTKAKSILSIEQAPAPDLIIQNEQDLSNLNDNNIIDNVIFP